MITQTLFGNLKGKRALWVRALVLNSIWTIRVQVLDEFTVRVWLFVFALASMSQLKSVDDVVD